MVEHGNDESCLNVVAVVEAGSGEEVADVHGKEGECGECEEVGEDAWSAVEFQGAT